MTHWLEAAPVDPIDTDGQQAGRKEDKALDASLVTCRVGLKEAAAAPDWDAVWLSILAISYFAKKLLIGLLGQEGSKRHSDC